MERFSWRSSSYQASQPECPHLRPIKIEHEEEREIMRS
jgi:hypothetical protein